MGLIDKITSPLGFKGVEQQKIKGAVVTDDLHQEDGKFTATEASHVGTHTVHDLPKSTAKYIDNLPT